MKKILILAFMGVALFCASCTKDCTCVTTFQFTSPGQTILNRDTVVVDSKDDCSLMNLDTVYVMHSYDSLGNINGTGEVFQTTICE
ncbi:MAG: hypothetical protein J5741_01180 [Bacteroidales bacterium]|nr:hypothetical protein [Bacteroidales bacterium]